MVFLSQGEVEKQLNLEREAEHGKQIDCHTSNKYLYELTPSNCIGLEKLEVVVMHLYKGDASF